MPNIVEFINIEIMHYNKDNSVLIKRGPIQMSMVWVQV